MPRKEDPIVVQGIWAIVAPLPASLVLGVWMTITPRELNAITASDVSSALLFAAITAGIAFPIAVLMVFMYAIPAYRALTSRGSPRIMTIVVLALIPGGLVALINPSFSAVVFYFSAFCALGFFSGGYWFERRVHE